MPGNPDIVLPKYKTGIFVNGCFWNQHEGYPKAKRPTSNVAFWNQKFDKTIARDLKNLTLLDNLGWKVLIIWECELKDEKIGEKTLSKLLLTIKKCISMIIYLPSLVLLLL